jgi:hypothetical protein
MCGLWSWWESFGCEVSEKLIEDGKLMFGDVFVDFSWWDKLVMRGK